LGSARVEGRVDTISTCPSLSEFVSHLRDVLISTGQVDHRTTRHGLNQNLQGCRFAISMNDSVGDSVVAPP
jgi:hypothetical protein